VKNDHQFVALHVAVEGHLVARLEFAQALRRSLSAGQLGETPSLEAVACQSG
jgi:hypothetical protein